jgi:hypothetical protein
LVIHPPDFSLKDIFGIDDPLPLGIYSLPTLASTPPPDLDELVIDYQIGRVLIIVRAHNKFSTHDGWHYRNLTIGAGQGNQIQVENPFLYAIEFLITKVTFLSSIDVTITLMCKDGFLYPVAHHWEHQNWTKVSVNSWNIAKDQDFPKINIPRLNPDLYSEMIRALITLNHEACNRNPLKPQEEFTSLILKSVPDQLPDAITEVAGSRPAVIYVPALDPDWVMQSHPLIPELTPNAPIIFVGLPQAAFEMSSAFDHPNLVEIRTKTTRGILTYRFAIDTNRWIGDHPLI